MSKRKILICMVIAVLTACTLISGCTNSSVETESTTVTAEQTTVTEVALTEKETEKSVNKVSLSEMSETTDKTSSSKTKAKTEKPKATVTEKQTTVKTTKPHTTAKTAEVTEKKQPTTAKETTTKKVTTTKNVTTTKQTTTQKTDFDIERYVSFAKDYALSVGLELDSSATDCWDNPITANPSCKYIERDIKSRLNKYAKAEDISAVWIWAEKTGSESYNIYIGYA